MKNKLLLKIGLIVFSLGLSYPLFTSATMFHLTGLKDIYALSPDRVVDNMMYVHFADNINNFGGFLYFSSNKGDGESSNTTDLPRVTTNGSDASVYKCKNRVKGFYYNAERGERLWPLDNETRSGLEGTHGLETTGGIYTMCAQSGYQEALLQCEDGTYPDCTNCDYNVCTEKVRQQFKADGYGFYGSLVQTYSGKEHTLTMGVNYDKPAGAQFISIESGSDLAPTFVRIDNKYPVGFIYDNLGGVGLAGCKLTTGDIMRTLVKEAESKGLSEIFEYSTTSGHLVYTGNYLPREYVSCENISLADRLMKIIIEGIMGVNGNGKEGEAKFGALGNSTDTKMQYFATQSVSNTTMMNYARRKAELLCRGKWINSNINTSNSDKIICWEGSKIDTGSSEWAKTNGKTLIVKNADVEISPINDENDTTYHDIFIMSGDLLINETDAQKFVFDDKGFITDIGYESVVQGERVIVSPMVAFRMWITVISHGLTINSTTISSLIHYNLCKQGVGMNCDNLEIENYYDADMDGNIDMTDIKYWATFSLWSGPNEPVNSVASLIKGNFIVNGNIKSANGDVLNNKYFIHGKITTKDTFGDLENVFAWRCDNEWGTDGNYCPRSGPYRNASLIVIDQNYSSPLLQS